MDINNLTIVGRLTREPELRYTSNQTPVCNFSIACNKDKNQADFFNCVAWKGTAENINKFLKKGSQVIISGRIAQKSWTDKDGQKKNSVEIVAHSVQFVGGKKDDYTQKTSDGGYQSDNNQQEEDYPSADVPF